MKKILFALFLLFFSFSTFAQSIVVIDKDKTTAPLFDDTDPLSLIGVLKAGLYDLGNFDLAGMSDSLVGSLSSEEKATTLKFAKMYHDYKYDENGEPLVVYNEASEMYDYVFIPPDTIHTSLDNIERIVLNVADGDGLKIHRTQSIEFWKKYGGKLHKVLSVNATIVDLQGFKIIRPVNDVFQTLWLDKKDPNSMWNQMKSASYRVKSDFEEGVIGEEKKGFVMEFFPIYSAIPFTVFFGGSPKIVEEQIMSEENYLVVVDKDFNENLPFQFTHGDSLFLQEDYKQQLESKFEELRSISIESDLPMIDMDPDSPNFMSELMIENVDGVMEYIYPEPILVYLWCEYNHIQMYAIEEFVFDGNTDEMRTKIVGLCFTQISEIGKPEIISFTKTEEEFNPFFENYPSEKLNNLAWNKILKKEIENASNAYQLSNTKDLKRLKKRNEKLKK